MIQTFVFNVNSDPFFLNGTEQIQNFTTLMKYSYFKFTFNADIAPHQILSIELVAKNQTENITMIENPDLILENIVTLSNETKKDEDNGDLYVIKFSFILNENESNKLLFYGISLNDSVNNRLTEGKLVGFDNQVDHFGSNHLASKCFFNVSITNLNLWDKIYIYYEISNLDMKNKTKIAFKQLKIKVHSFYLN